MEIGVQIHCYTHIIITIKIIVEHITRVYVCSYIKVILVKVTKFSHQGQFNSFKVKYKISLLYNCE